MKDKEFVLVSQGIEIYRTKSQEKAINIVKKENDEYFDYQQKCYDNYERPADNYVDLEIEYSDEKEKGKEIERLNNIINELEKELEKDFHTFMCNSREAGKTYKAGGNVYREHILLRLRELKEVK